MALAVAVAGLFAVSCTGGDRYVAFRGYAQGGTYTVKVNLRGVRERPQEISERIDSILTRIDASLSGYNKGSVLSRLNRGDTVRPDELFLDMYERAYALYEESGGVVDAAGGPLYDVWGFGFTEGEMPSDEAVAQARAASGMSRLRRDIRGALRPDGTLAATDLLLSPGGCPQDCGGHGARDLQPAAPSAHAPVCSSAGKPLGRSVAAGTPAPAPVLNFNAIAQGYSCDLIAQYLHSLGIHDMLVDIGEIWCEGRNPDGKPWSIGIDRPTDGNNTPGADMQGIWRSKPDGPGQGVVTSGNYRKYYIRDGRKYSHTIDPRSGRPVSHNLLSATIVAPDATTADAVATWCMVVGLEESEALLRRLALDGCLIWSAPDGSCRVSTTAGFALDDAR